MGAGSEFDFLIGAGSTNSQYFNGSIDEVMVYNRDLSEAEINDIIIAQS